MGRLFADSRPGKGLDFIMPGGRAGSAWLPEVMMLGGLLVKKRDEILRKWFSAVLESYPPDSRPFLACDHNPFANPVGAAISEGIAELYDRIAGDGPDIDLGSDFIELMKVRAVQDFSPSRAVVFVMGLKRVVRESLGDEVRHQNLGDDLIRFEDRVDQFTLAAFDAFMGARERLYDVRARELSHRSSLLLARAGVSAESEIKCPSQLDLSSCPKCDSEER